jgi:hypothetical protein
MEFKVGDLVAAEQWSAHGDKTCLGMIVARNTSSWKIDWYGIEVEFSWYTPDDIKLFRDNYLKLRKENGI